MTPITPDAAFGDAYAERNALNERLLACLVAAGYPRIEPPILQPAASFLDLSGEDIRGRMYLTSDGNGAELCLRPEYTIPVARAYLASPQAGRAAAFSYLGPVFRFRPGASGEFIQAGVESFGRNDREAADAEILAVVLEAADAAGHAELAIAVGDVGLFSSFLEALKLPSLWHRRLRRGVANGQGLDAILAGAENGTPADHAGVLAALAAVDQRSARALVEDVLSIAGIVTVGGRSAGEIAERFLEQASLRSGSGLGAPEREALARFLAVEGDPDTASRALRALAKDAGLNLGGALDRFDARTGFLAARGIDVGRLRFAARFARNLDYYTGFVFEVSDPRRADGRPVVGGGRYDRLLQTLGAGAEIPAVGASLWVERLGGQDAFRGGRS